MTNRRELKKNYATFVLVLISSMDYFLFRYSPLVKLLLHYGCDPTAEDDTGYFFSEALIFASINPKYDNRLFIKLQVQYKKTTNCSECQNNNNNLCRQHFLQVFRAYNFYEQ